MITNLTYRQVGTMAAVVTGLVFVSGCRSASVTSGSRVNPAPNAYGEAPFYRPDERTPQPYDGENFQSPSSQPTPAILPVPGYSEPGVPPAPSAQKSRWNLVPSNFKLPSLNRRNTDIHQTVANDENHGSRSKEGKKIVSSLKLQKRQSDVVEEVVRPRSAPSESAPEFRVEGMTDQKRSSEQWWPSATTESGASGESDSFGQIAPPAIDVGTSPEAPLLLPPDR